MLDVNVVTDEDALAVGSTDPEVSANARSMPMKLIAPMSINAVAIAAWSGCGDEFERALARWSRRRGLTIGRSRVLICGRALPTTTDEHGPTKTNTRKDEERYSSWLRSVAAPPSTCGDEALGNGQGEG